MILRRAFVHVALVFLLACESASPAGKAAADGGGQLNASGPRVACGSGMSSDDAVECCPVSWQSGNSCHTNDPQSERCWTGCVRTTLHDGPDGGSSYWRGRLTCGTQGVILAGKGLYPCTP